ncbi:MAG: glycosyltransferase family 4 protein [Christensenellaceae bacterium]|nr:glycosyltransferase family 4 protein [Christensenellaceae bacterium]
MHFIDRSIWDGLKDSLEHNNLIIWLHGADIHPLERRGYKYANEKELAKEKEKSKKLVLMWKEIFNHKFFKNIHMVFVSNNFKNEVFEDYNINLPESNFSVIHNFIDNEKFNYVKKPVEQRKKIITIKPFASYKYANDITQKAIIELSKHEIFNDLEFAIYGDGQYFERDTAGLENFPNVKLNKGFLLQEDIAKLHKEYGIYIATTRNDTQGVSRDEAMSSGLVPIANAVMAIPEFVDENCGILVDAEDYKGVADAIVRLYNEPELFEKLSQGAAERVRQQTGYEQTIGKEIELINKIKNKTLV